LIKIRDVNFIEAKNCKSKKNAPWQNIGQIKEYKIKSSTKWTISEIGIWILNQNRIQKRLQNLIVFIIVYTKALKCF
jgi:hypothetical protein